MTFPHSVPPPPQGDPGLLCRIRNLEAFFSAFYFYHINDHDQNKTSHKKEQTSPHPHPSCPLGTLKWFIAHSPEPVALPWEGYLRLSWGQLQAINTPGSPYTGHRGGVTSLSPRVLLRHSPLRAKICLYLVEISRVGVFQSFFSHFLCLTVADSLPCVFLVYTSV